MATQSAVEKYQKLKAEADKFLTDAVAEARQKADEAIADLNALGAGTYSLVDGGKKAKGPSKQRQVKDELCVVCNFKTAPPHDGRKHRSQGKDKKPFTAKELADMGMSKV